MGLNRVQIGTLTTCLLILITISIILFASAFATIVPTYCGINFNSVTNDIDETRVYYEGRHWLGLGHTFIQYPMIWQIMDFSNDNTSGDLPLDAGSRDGQPITVEVTVFYSIIPSQIINLYHLLGTTCESEKERGKKLLFSKK